MTPHRPLALALLLASAFAAMPAHADGLADLKSALARLQGTAPVKGQAELKTWHKVGEGSDVSETRAQAGVAVEDGPRGLQLLYARDLVARLDAERRARAANPQAKTPTVDAMRELQLDDLQPVVSAATGLQRTIDRAKFTGERADTYNGKPARVLTFTSGMEQMSERDRKYVKEYDAGVDVWIAADGTPLAARHHSTMHGRAYVVVSFSSTDEQEEVFAVAADRLVTTKKEQHQVTSGMGDRDERRVTLTTTWGG